MLVHGIADDGSCWTPVAEIFHKDFDIIMVDQRGHGKSDAPEDGYTIENLGKELHHFLQKLDITKPILLGHSLGAIASLVLAGMYPDYPMALLLEDPASFWNIDSNKKFVASRDMHIQVAKMMKRMTSDEMLAFGIEHSPGWSKAELDPWVNSKHRFDPIINDFTFSPELESNNFSELFEQITCPALLISADVEQGAVSSEEDISMLQEWVPQLKVSHIENSGHCIRRDQFEVYIDVVKKTLATLE